MAGRPGDGWLKFIREHKALFDSASASPWSILVKCIAETAVQGADAVVAFLRQAREEGFSLDFGNPITFPDGFDFGGLLGSDDFQALGLGEMKQAMIAAWREKDREAAFDWLLEHGDSKDLQALTRYGPDWAPDTRSWLVGKLTTEGISTIAAILRPEDRKSFALGRLIGSRGEGKIFTALETLPRSDLLEVLQEGAKRHSGMLNSPEPSPRDEGIRRLYQEAERRYSLTPEEIQSIHASGASRPE